MFSCRRCAMCSIREALVGAVRANFRNSNIKASGPIDTFPPDNLWRQIYARFSHRAEIPVALFLALMPLKLLRRAFFKERQPVENRRFTHPMRRDVKKKTPPPTGGRDCVSRSSPLLCKRASRCRREVLLFCSALFAIPVGSSACALREMR